MIKTDKWERLLAWMQQLKIQNNDLLEKFITGSGKGGQKLHKTASTVYLKHLPSGIEIKCQKTRSREDNRYFARVNLCEKMHPTVSKIKTKEHQRVEKLIRQKKRRTRRRHNSLNADKNPSE